MYLSSSPGLFEKITRFKGNSFKPSRSYAIFARSEVRLVEIQNESAANYSKWKNLGRSKVELVCLHASLTRNRFVRAKINGRCARKRRPALPSWNGRSIEPITELSSVAGGVCRFPRQMNGLQSSVHGTSSSAGFERMNVALHADSTNTKGARFFQRFFGYSIWKQYRHFHSNNRQPRFHSPSDFSDRLLPRNSQIFREIRQLCLSRGLE